jgi:hypothetical protein
MRRNASKSVEIRRNPSQFVEIRQNPSKSVEIRRNCVEIRRNALKHTFSEGGPAWGNKQHHTTNNTEQQKNKAKEPAKQKTLSLHYT